MELEETEDEEWYTSKYSSQPNNAKISGNLRWLLKRGLCLGRKILVAGFVASAAPVVVPPLVVASAIGLAVSMPCAIFLASHACTQNLMSKLLPRPTPQNPQLREEMCYEEEQALSGEAKRDIEIDGVQCMKNGENVSLVCECGPREEDATDGIEGHSRGETNGVVTMIEGLDKIGSEIEEFETPFEVTTVVLEESQDQDMEGDIEEAELKRETKGLLEKIRDEGRTRDVEGICGGENENDHKVDLVIEDMEVAREDTDRDIIGETEEDPNICEEMVQSRNGESEETICNEVGSDEYARGLLERKEFNDTNDSQKSMAETCELLHGSCFTHENVPIGDLRMQKLVYNVPVDEVVIEKAEIHFAEEDPEPPLDYPTQLQEGRFDNSISDTENQETHVQLHHELKEVVYSSDAEAREIANESALDLFEGKKIRKNEYAFTIDLHKESSNVDGHTDSMEVLISSVEQESRPSECSSGENIIFPTQEFVFQEENIWKQIDVMRKIIGYEDTKQARCADELKALYIFIGVEPPTCLNENTSDPDEIEEKLHFLMSIVGIK